MAIELIKIDADVDGKGMSILRKQYEIINGTRYYSIQQRKSFRTENIIFVNDVETFVINTEYSAEIDEWTGIQNFLTTVYNQ